MKILNYTFSIILFCAIAQITFGQTFPVTTIQNNGADNKHINLVFMGDGYTASQQGTFITDVNAIVNDLFSQTPFSEYKDFFNVYAIEVPSNESGADHPGTAVDVVEPAFPIQDVDNYFGSTFDAFGIHRLLVAMNSSAINNVLAANFPSYDQAFIVVNSPHYGGSGGSIATSSTNQSAAEIAIHEIGHSFASLADEYWAGNQFAAERANMTQESNPIMVRWADWVNIDNVGVYQYGTSGNQALWHRPHQNCKMQFLGFDFCAVCTEAFIDQIYSLVTPIKATTPATSSVTFDGTPIDFQVDLINPNPNTLAVEWNLNGTVVNSTTNVLTISSSDLQPGNNALNFTVTDNTPLSKSYLPASGYVFTYSWNIVNNTSSIDEVLLPDGVGKFFYKAFPNPTTDKFTLSYFYNQSDTDMTVNIHSIDGKITQTMQTTLQNGEGRFEVNVENLASGIYVVQLQTDTFSTSFEIVKE